MGLFHAPGRVNLIGDHIDYMGGTVMPMAIDVGTDVWVRPRTDRLVVAQSDNFRDLGTITADLDATGPRPEWDWVNYLVAMAFALNRRGITVPGLDVRVRGNIPNGAGLSSSASLELAIGVAFNALAQAGLEPVELAVLGQVAENDFIGVACGIMDQLAVACGVAGNALAIECATLQVTPVPFPEDVAVVVANSNQRRELSQSAYNQRRSACERAQEILGRRLVDIPAAAVETAVVALPVDLRGRARHVITEQGRVLAFAHALADNDTATMGALMRESHESLRHDFDVTGDALDALVAAAWRAPGTIGARMTGAGFGGCTVNLVEPDLVDDFMAATARDYAQTGRTADFYRVRAADGAHEVFG
jgi:galactokinase